MKVRILESARRDPDQTGLRGWILDAAAAEGLRKGMQQVAGAKVIDRPRFSTGDGIASCMIAVPSGPSSSMPTGPGLRFDLFPRLRGNTTDLIFAIMSWTSSTNGAPTIKELRS